MYRQYYYSHHSLCCLVNIWQLQNNWVHSQYWEVGIRRVVQLKQILFSSTLHLNTAQLPGRTTNDLYLKTDWLNHLQAETTWVHVKKQCLNEEMHLQNFGLYCLWLFVIRGKRSQMTSSYACIMLLLWVKRKITIFIRQSSMTSIFIVLARLWHQSWHLRNLMILTSTNLLNFCPKSHVHFLIPSPFLHILCPTWYKKWHFLGSKFCPVCELCSFTLTL